MNRRCSGFFFAWIGAAWWVGFSAPAGATPVQVVLSPSAAIGGSGAWGGPFNLTSPWNTPGGPVGGLFNNQVSGATLYENTPPNPVETGWAGNDTDHSEYFVVDLGAAYTIDHFDFYNSHNGTFNDRSTGPFQVYASNAVAAPGACETGAGTCGLDLVSPTLILSASLLFDPDPINAQSFAPSVSGTFRYLRVDVLDEAGISNDGAGNGIALTELLVFAVPEPSTLALLGLSLTGLAIQGSRRPGRAS